MKLRLMIQKQYFEKFRTELSYLRQAGHADEARIIKMQKLCGEIETSLYNSLQLIPRRR